MIVSPCGVTKCVKEKALTPVSGMQGILSKCCYWFLYTVVFPRDAIVSPIPLERKLRWARTQGQGRVVIC